MRTVSVAVCTWLHSPGTRKDGNGMRSSTLVSSAHPDPASVSSPSKPDPLGEKAAMGCLTVAVDGGAVDTPMWQTDSSGFITLDMPPPSNDIPTVFCDLEPSTLALLSRGRRSRNRPIASHSGECISSGLTAVLPPDVSSVVSRMVAETPLGSNRMRQYSFFQEVLQEHGWQLGQTTRCPNLTRGQRASRYLVHILGEDGKPPHCMSMFIPVHGDCMLYDEHWDYRFNFDVLDNLIMAASHTGKIRLIRLSESAEGISTGGDLSLYAAGRSVPIHVFIVVERRRSGVPAVCLLWRVDRSVVEPRRPAVAARAATRQTHRS